MPEIEVPESFLREAEGLRLSVLNEDGDYVHLRFQGADASRPSFEINTWPGHLCWASCPEAYLFRVDGPLEFFSGKPNPAYWAGKCVAHGGSEVTKFDDDLFREAVVEALNGMGARDWLRQEAMNGLEDAGEDPEAALEWYGELGVEVSREGVYAPTREFLYCCHSLSWGLARFRVVCELNGLLEREYDEDEEPNEEDD